MLELEEKIDIYRCCEEKRGHLKLVRLASDADTAAEKGTMPGGAGLWRAQQQSPLGLA